MNLVLRRPFERALRSSGIVSEMGCSQPTPVNTTGKLYTAHSCLYLAHYLLEGCSRVRYSSLSGTDSCSL
jgi:hypothetical protein